MNTTAASKSVWPALRASLLYGAVAGAWIVYSDAFLATLATDAAALNQLQTYKGLIFVAVTTGLVFWLMWTQLRNARAEAAARKAAEVSRLRFASMVESSNDAIIGKTLDGTITDWNRGAEQLFGYTADEVLGTSIMRVLPRDRAQEEARLIEKIKQGRPVAPFETVRLTRAGQALPVSVSASPVQDDTGAITGIAIIARDITVQKEHERELDRLTRLYAALSHINQSIVWTTAREELFQKVCRILVEQGGFHMAWIGWHNPETQQIAPVAAWGDEDNYSRNIRVYADDRLEGRGPTGRAFRSGEPYICNDILNNPVAQPWRESLMKHGYRSSAAFPIRAQNIVCATLSVYSDEPFFFQDKEIALLVEAASDISFALGNFAEKEARRQVEEAVQNERLFSATMIESMPGIIYFYDGQGRFLRWNRNFEAVSGYTGDEIARMHPLDFFAEHEKELLSQRIAEVFEKGDSFVEASFRSKDGRATPYFFTGRRVMFNGQTCLVGMGVDISERTRAEAALRTSEAIYRTLFELAPLGILIADKNSTYLDANACMCRMLGYTHQELVGLNATDIISLDETADIPPVLEEIQAHIPHHREWRFRRKDGTLFPVQVSATMLPDGNLLGMVTDITERKRAEAALRELNTSLEQKVSERTEELRAALERAEAADRIKSAFLATMSHELRTPLNSIIGFTGIVLQGLAGPLNPEQTKQLGMVRNSARHLLDLINDVLDISKIEAGQLEVRAESFDLCESMERVKGLVKPLADRKGLALEGAVPAAPLPMRSDRRRVEQILLNLLNNAIKFTDRGRVALDAERLDNTRPPSVRIRVSDTGIGIKPGDLATLFQPFRQVDSGLTRQHEGTGLGLAICRRLAALLGGEITAGSEWEKGSVFTVTLPLENPRT